MISRRALIAGAAALALPRLGHADSRAPGLRNRSTGQIKRAGVPRIDRAHPLAQQLLFYAFDTGAGVYVDLVSGRSGAHVAGLTTAGTAVSSWGQGTKFNTSDEITWASTAAIQTATANGWYSWACAVDPPAIQGSSNARPFCRTANNDGSQPFANWDFEMDASTPPVASGNVNNGGNILQIGAGTWATPSLNSYISLCGAASGGAGAAAMIATFYGNGTQQKQSTGLTAASANTNDNIMISGGSAAGADQPYTGFVYYGGFWGRTLSAAEALLLHADPYCFLIFAEDEMVGVRG